MFHNFITWKDIRANDIVRKWNESWTMKGLNVGSKLLYEVTRSHKFLAGSVLKIMNAQVTPRLLWVLESNRELQHAVKSGDALFGTIDSFLFYRLRQGNTLRMDMEHISEITNCTATGLYDPFSLQWAGWAISMFNLRKDMLPKVVDNSYDFGSIDKSYFGEPIRIAGIMGDQAASLFGSCCFHSGDAKVTLGTGTFFNINTDKKCHASVLGLYPLVAWMIKDKDVTYCVEGNSSDTATVINWGKSIGLYDDPKETARMAEAVTDSDGVYFIPSFFGLSAPINDFKATTGFLGIHPETTKNHLVRAMLESLVFRVAQLMEASMNETDYVIKDIRVDGGVSKNDFICQTLADLCDITVSRGLNSETTSLGIAYLCAYNTNNLTLEDAAKLYKTDKIFKPRPEYHEPMRDKMRTWTQAVERFKKWY